MLLPVIGIVQVGLQGHADRYTYLPHIGLYLLVTWGIVSLAERLPYRRQILGVAAALVILTLAWRAHAQTKSWHDTETLWKHATAVTSNNHFAHTALGDIAFSRDRIEEAIAHYQESLAAYPDNSGTHNKLGLALFRTGHPGAAIAHWKMSLRNFNSEANMAWIYATCPDPAMRDGAQALTLVQDAIQRSGERNPTILRTLAAAYAESGRFSEAITAAQEALDSANAQGNTALANDLRNDIDNYQKGVPLRDPSLANVHPWP
jgi:tetratricopeptide (TPR) repeat protein